MVEQDKGLSVQFWLHPVENKAASKKAGRPIFDEVEMVSVMAPGNTKTEFTARADRVHYDSNVGHQWTYAERFPEQYAAFKQGIEDHVQGTPINEAPFLSIGQKAEMRAKKITTIEQIASMSDRDVRAMGPGFRAHVDAAKAYLDVSSGSAALSGEMAELRRQNEELTARLSKVEAKSEPSPKAASQFDALADEDLRNMLTDAGVTVDGRWGKARLVQEAEALAAKSQEAA